MIKISSDQALQRWGTIPDSLREALVSEANSDFLWKTAQNENVPEESIYTIAKIFGYVLLGFLHPEDVAEELTQATRLDPKTAKTIQDALNQRIFSSLKQDIDGVYQPLTSLEAGMAPKMIQDIGAPAMSVSMNAPKPPASSVSSQSFNAAMSVGMKPAPSMPGIPPIAPKPSTPEKGWSRATPNDPVIKFAPMQGQAPAPKPAAPAQPSQPAPAIQPKPATSSGYMSIGGEFDRLTKAQGTPAPASAAPKAPIPAPTSAAAPAPVILHEDPQFKTIKSSSDFRISMPNQENIISSAPKAPMPPKAVLEFGNTGAAPAPQIPKVVHYTEYGKSATSSMPPQPSGNTDRHVTELTATPHPAQSSGFASVPVPIPQTPTAPKPPAQPAPQTPPPSQAQDPAKTPKVVNY